MKIAVATDSSNAESQVSSHAARAAFYLLYDKQGKFLDAIENPYSKVDRGAAPRAAQLLREHGVGTLVAGEFGGRFVAQLEACSINAVVAKDTAEKAVQEILV